MDLNALKIFAAVAAESSVSRAAQRLDYVQSNVTARVKQLEEELETPLFYRHKRGMQLTPAGTTLLRYTERLLRLLEEAREAVRETGAIGGRLALGSMETTAAVRLPPLLARYHQAYPAVDLLLTTGTSEELVSQVLAFRLDGAFVGGPVDHPDLEAEELFREELVLVTAAAVQRLETLHSRTALVFRQGCGYRARLEHVLRERGVVPYRLMEFGTLDGILGCVAAGMGVTLLPRSVVGQPRFEGSLALHALPPAMAMIPTVFVRRRDTVRMRALEALLALMRSAADPPSAGLATPADHPREPSPDGYRGGAQ